MSSSLLCKNFNVAHYLKSIKDTFTKLGILTHHDKVQLQDKGHNSDRNNFGVMPLFKENVRYLQVSALVLHAVLLFSHLNIIHFITGHQWSSYVIQYNVCHLDKNSIISLEKMKKSKSWKICNCVCMFPWQLFSEISLDLEYN